MKRFETFSEFYPFYLTEHNNTTCRALHFIGTTLVIATTIIAIVTQTWWMFAFLPILGYGFAWLGHFAFEKNRPAAFKQPIFSLLGDFKMFWDIITFQLPQKLDEARKKYNY